MTSPMCFNFISRWNDVPIPIEKANINSIVLRFQDDVRYFNAPLLQKLEFINTDRELKVLTISSNRFKRVLSANRNFVFGSRTNKRIDILIFECEAEEMAEHIHHYKPSTVIFNAQVKENVYRWIRNSDTITNVIIGCELQYGTEIYFDKKCVFLYSKAQYYLKLDNQQKLVLSISEETLNTQQLVTAINPDYVKLNRRKKMTASQYCEIEQQKFILKVAKQFHAENTSKLEQKSSYYISVNSNQLICQSHFISCIRRIYASIERPFPD